MAVGIRAILSLAASPAIHSSVPQVALAQTADQPSAESSAAPLALDELQVLTARITLYPDGGWAVVNDPGR